MSKTSVVQWANEGSRDVRFIASVKQETARFPECADCGEAADGYAVVACKACGGPVVLGRERGTETVMLDRQTTWPHGYPCGCNLETGFCATHKPMIHELHALWHGDGKYAADSARFDRVWALCDTYGTPGTIPPQGFDWSGIRDARPATLEAMYAECVRESIP